MEREPLYKHIYDVLLDDIEKGTYRKGAKLPSEKDLAAAFHVSRITTKRALNMLMEKGYIKRYPGRGSFVCKEKHPQSSEKPIIGLILPDIYEGFGVQVLRGVEQEARIRGYGLELVLTKASLDLENAAITQLLSRAVGGLIIMPVPNRYHNPSILRLVLEGYPVVLLDRRLEGIQTPYVGIDNFHAAFEATEYLLNKGHSQIAYCSVDPESASNLRARYAGFQAAFKARNTAWDEGLLMPVIQSSALLKQSDGLSQESLEKMIHFFEAHPQTQAVLATGYYLTQMVHTALTRLGKGVPEDVSLMGFDGPVNSFQESLFTRMIQPELEIGQAAVDLMEKLFHGEEALETRFTAVLHERQSVKAALHRLPASTQ